MRGEGAIDQDRSEPMLIMMQVMKDKQSQEYESQDVQVSLINTSRNQHKAQVRNRI